MNTDVPDQVYRLIEIPHSLTVLGVWGLVSFPFSGSDLVVSL
jgi:hypothetical protein